MSTNILSLYQVWAEAKYNFVWSISIPTVSPIDGGSIDTNKNLATTKKINIGTSIKNITSSDSPYSTLDNIQINADTSSGNIVINLRTATDITGKIYNIVKTNTLNTVTINPYGSETIGGESSKTLTFNQNNLTIVSDGTNWNNSPEEILTTDPNLSSVSSIETVNSTGIGVFKNMLQSTAIFKKIDTESSKITLTDNTNTVGLDVYVPALIDDNTTSSTNLWSASKVDTSTTNQVSSTTTTTITNTTDILLNTMTITPVSGTYMVMFSCTGKNSNGNGDLTISLYIDGTRQNHTERILSDNKNKSISTQSIETVNGSQSIEIKWKHSGSGNSEITARTLSVVRLGS